MDDVDRAQTHIETMVDQTLHNRVQYLGESATWCEECGDVIPQARRQAIPGVRLCVGCQNEHEGRR